MPDQEHGTDARAQDVLGRRTEEEAVDGAARARAEDDEIRPFAGRLLDLPMGAAEGHPQLHRRAVGDVTRDLQILQIRGIFSGGPSSNRGYGFNEIAPHRVLDENGQLLSSATSTGGRTMWEASVEVLDDGGAVVGLHPPHREIGS